MPRNCPLGDCDIVLALQLIFHFWWPASSHALHLQRPVWHCFSPISFCSVIQRAGHSGAILSLLVSLHGDFTKWGFLQRDENPKWSLLWFKAHFAENFTRHFTCVWNVAMRVLKQLCFHWILLKLSPPHLPYMPGFSFITKRETLVKVQMFLRPSHAPHISILDFRPFFQSLDPEYFLIKTVCVILVLFAGPTGAWRVSSSSQYERECCKQIILGEKMSCTCLKCIIIRDCLFLGSLLIWYNRGRGWTTSLPIAHAKSYIHNDDYSKHPAEKLAIIVFARDFFFFCGSL